MPASINGFGTRYYGQRDFLPDGSYVTTEWITAAFVPVIPLRSYRLIRNSKQDVNVVVYRSAGYIIVQTLPNNGKQVLSVYSFVVLCILLMFATLHFLTVLDSRWPGHEEFLAIPAIVTGVFLTLLPRYLRSRARATVTYSHDALVETLNRLVAERQPNRSMPPPLPTAPPPLPRNE